MFGAQDNTLCQRGLDVGALNAGACQRLVPSNDLYLARRPDAAEDSRTVFGTGEHRQM